MEHPREVGKCVDCRDPIYDRQEMVIVKGKKHHIGCYAISPQGKHIKLSAPRPVKIKE